MLGAFHRECVRALRRPFSFLAQTRTADWGTERAFLQRAQGPRNLTEPPRANWVGQRFTML